MNYGQLTGPGAALALTGASTGWTILTAVGLLVAGSAIFYLARPRKAKP